MNVAVGWADNKLKATLCDKEAGSSNKFQILEWQSLA
jgi:hypothetical protein